MDSPDKKIEPSPFFRFYVYSYLNESTGLAVAALMAW